MKDLIVASKTVVALRITLLSNLMTIPQETRSVIWVLKCLTDSKKIMQYEVKKQYFRVPKTWPVQITNRTATILDKKC